MNEEQAALEKITSESSRSEANLRAQAGAVVKALNAKRARVERLKRHIAAEAKKRQNLLPERWEKSEAANRQLAEDRESLQKLQSKVATVTANVREWRKLPTDTAEGLKVATTGVVLQSGLWKAAQEEMDIKTDEIVELQEQLAAKNAGLLPYSAKSRRAKRQAKSCKIAP